MSDKPIVYVTQEMPRLDYVPAEKFGDVVFLTRDDFSSVSSSLINDGLVKTIKDKLKLFREETDYIVFSGSPTVAAAVFAFIGKKADAFRVLRWSNRDGHYTPIHIRL